MWLETLHTVTCYIFFYKLFYVVMYNVTKNLQERCLRINVHVESYHKKGDTRTNLIHISLCHVTNTVRFLIVCNTHIIFTGVDTT